MHKILFAGSWGRKSGSEWTRVILGEIGLCAFEQRARGTTTIAPVLSPSLTLLTDAISPPCCVSLGGCTSPTLLTPWGLTLPSSCPVEVYADYSQPGPAVVTLGKLCRLFWKALESLTPPFTCPKQHLSLIHISEPTRLQ